VNEIIEIVKNFASTIGFIPTLIILAVFGLYIFWSESHITRKDRNSVFDIFLLVFVLTVIWGRVSYIISNPADFEGLIWSLAPYEKYSDGIYYFRLLPWKYFSIWDGGFLFISMYVAFTILAFSVSTYLKKWRWREMIGVVTISASAMIGLSFIIAGLFSGSNIIYQQGVAIIVIYLVYLLVHKFLKVIFKRKHDRYEKITYNLHFVYFVLVNVFILFSLLTSEISQIERIGLYLLGVYVLVGSVTFIYDMQRKNIVVDTVFRSPRLPKVGSTVRMRKKTDEK
jgi:hypothetical protein